MNARRGRLLGRRSAGARRPAASADDRGFQGWVEADFIFVSPDEAGPRRDAVGARGRQVEKGAPLFTLDADLQQADVDWRTSRR